jgi:hypothetical protein
VTSVAKHEIKSMQAAGWTVVSYGPWERLRALLGRGRPVGRAVTPQTDVYGADVVTRVHLPRPAGRPVQGWSR